MNEKNKESRNALRSQMSDGSRYLQVAFDWKRAFKLEVRAGREAQRACRGQGSQRGLRGQVEDVNCLLEGNEKEMNP